MPRFRLSENKKIKDNLIMYVVSCTLGHSYRSSKLLYDSLGISPTYTIGRYCESHMKPIHSMVHLTELDDSHEPNAT